MYFEEIKEVIKNISQDERLNSDNWIIFESDIIFLLEPAIKLSDTFQYFLGVSSRTAEHLIDYAERYNLYSDVKEARMKAIDEFNNLKLEFPEKIDCLEIQKKELLDEINIQEDKFFLSAVGKTAYDTYLKTVHRLYLSQLAGGVKILGEWKGAETYMRPLEFMQWAINNGYEMPEIVEILYNEESNINTLPQNHKNQESQTEDELTPKEYAEKLIAQGLHKGLIMKKIYEKYNKKITQWQCAAIVLGGDIREIKTDEYERNRYKSAYQYNVTKYEKL